MDSVSWTGFSSWVNFIKASLTLGSVLVAGTYATITYGLDDRYASKDMEIEVFEITKSVAKMRKLQIKSAIPVAQATSCNASGPAKGAYAQQVEDLRAEYKDLTGADLYVPACEDLSVN